MAEISDLLKLIDGYCTAVGNAESTVSTRFFGAGHRVRQLRDGSDMGVRRIARAIEQFSREWPADAEWPADVPRPAPTPAAAE